MKNQILVGLALLGFAFSGAAATHFAKPLATQYYMDGSVCKPIPIDLQCSQLGNGCEYDDGTNPPHQAFRDITSQGNCENALRVGN